MSSSSQDSDEECERCERSKQIQGTVNTSILTQTWVCVEYIFTRFCLDIFQKGFASRSSHDTIWRLLLPKLGCDLKIRHFSFNKSKDKKTPTLFVIFSKKCSCDDYQQYFSILTPTDVCILLIHFKIFVTYVLRMHR